MESAMPVAVLASGGIDSAVLVATLLSEGRAVQPIYVRFGLRWEPTEMRFLERFLSALAGRGRLRPLLALDEPVSTLYGAHWSTTGHGVPGADTPDEAVYLPGRNLLLLAKPIVWCAENGIEEIALGVLAGNPFPDSRRSFYDEMERLASTGLSRTIRILTPFAELAKKEVLRLAEGLPLEWTFSCIAPSGGLHCGSCNKCGERRRVFAELSIADPTGYASSLSGAAGRD